LRKPLPFLSVLMNLSYPMAPAEFVSQLSLCCHIFTYLLDFSSFFFTSVAICTIFLAFFSLYLQMPLVFPSNTVVSGPQALSWIHFGLTSLSFYSKKASYYWFLVLIDDLSLTQLQGLFSILICLCMFALQTNNYSFFFDTLFLLGISDFVLAQVLSSLFDFSEDG